MATNHSLSWYETSLLPPERKQKGHFSTPPRLIEEVLDACGYTAEHDLSHLRVLDPACGSGNFLISATQRLMTFGARAGLDDDALATLVQHNIWGFDPDPVACCLAEMQLQTTFSQQLATIHSSITALPESLPNAEQSACHQQRRLQNKILHYPHIHQADGLAFPWGACENVDLFLANPPYLASKNTDLSGYRLARQRGQADSYLLFLRLALQVVRPHGWIGLVLPDALLARASASRERQLLLAETTVHHLAHLSDVFEAFVGAVVIIAQKSPPSRNHQINWSRGQWRTSHSKGCEKTTTRAIRKKEPFPALSLHGDAKKTIAQALLHTQPGAELRYLLSEVQGTLLARLYTYCHHAWQLHERSCLTSLDTCVVIRRGEEISKDSSLLHKIKPVGSPESPKDGPWYPVLRGGVDVRPYRISVAQCWLTHGAIQKPLDRYLAPKILIVKSTGRLQAALDLYGHVVLQTLYLLRLRPDRPLLGQVPCIASPTAHRDEDDLYFLLALLNSRLLEQYMYVLHTAYKWVQPQIEQHVLMHLPIPTMATMMEKEQIVQRARLLMGACNKLGSIVELKVQREALYAEQEQAICTLYTAALEG